MPDLTFVLPHWLYWSGLIVFPLVATWIVRRQRRDGAKRGTSLPIAYFLLVTGGFVGLHRFYLRSLWGLIFIPLLLAILYGNVQGREAQDGVSAARNEVMIAEFDLERAQQQVANEIAGAAQKLAQAKAADTEAREQLTNSQAQFTSWQRVSGGLALAIAVLLLIDAFLLPRLTRRVVDVDRGRETLADSADHVLAGREGKPASTPAVHSRFTDLIDKVNGVAGEFVAYWSVIAVFVYFYEVLARYVFNSPTNWAHESMFLMFGMQYLLAGGFALREGSHVRVDVVYLHFSDRTKALVDVITSVFFFIFIVTLLWTGFTFFKDSLAVWEVSFTEWAIQYWPVKLAIPLGAALILLQGIARLIKDILILTAKEA